MSSLNLSFRNCHGIGELDVTFEFNKGNAVAIYAPNGTMKTSFAKTFKDYARGVDTQDRIFPSRETTRSITDASGSEWPREDVVVVLSYDEELRPTKSTSTLLVNPDLRSEYELLHQGIVSDRDKLVEALKRQAATKRDVAGIVSRVFTQRENNFFNALVELRHEIAEQASAPLADVPLDVFFNDKVESLLRSVELQSVLADYTVRLNHLLDESEFFNRGAFTLYNASKVTKSLDDNGFFEANHLVLLRRTDADPHPVAATQELEQLISAERDKITDDSDLRDALREVERALNKNAQTRAFFDYLSSNTHLLPELMDIESFERSIWKSYIKKNEGLYEQVVDSYQAAERRRKEIEAQAAEERTQWEHVIDIFNDRFFVPFRLVATNRDRVVLGQEAVLNVGFEFEDGEERAPVERGELLQVLSNGEKKALYILNVLFEVEQRRASGRKTLFVVDDIADSFDYKNKYAIIQYLKEMSDDPTFNLILLTHNFDFFRTLESRGVVGYNKCFMTQRDSGNVKLSQAVGIRNPFVNDFKLRFFDEGMKRIACIPFLRNILEYTKGESSPGYISLTSLLHWKSDSDSISHSTVDRLFTETFDSTGAWPDPSGRVVDLIFSQANAALEAGEGVNFENKIVLSIAIRLAAERHMVDCLNDPAFSGSVQANQTQVLFKAYQSGGHSTAKSLDILGRVVLMTPENIHVNSFMYEPIIDMSDSHLRKLYSEARELSVS